MAEEHLLLRVPDEIQVRLDANATKESPEQVYYEKESGRRYIFVIGRVKECIW